MNLLYYAILIGGILIVSLYFYKKNKKDFLLYLAKENGSEESEENEDSEEIDGEDKKSRRSRI